jgi:hypothetical protein
MDNHPNLPRVVLAQYDLGQVHAVAPQAGGGIDESFLVTAESGRYFFKRRSPAYTPATVACDHALFRFLVRHAFPTPATTAWYRDTSPRAPSCPPGEIAP